ncbi:hypothetical protein GLOIN_2v1112497 [Rhizophagus irregularis DAOM 181602=DAOM 197198]|uniref:Uncharacterized protein n=1 Tax=Rhizophagus irregularis (strain DAOM 181602 / DAOM 197198 / MUCL 43194) TaxID=747089 RepID=A0A2P4Q736_RHIID|nr:hypothetical protein GLOIN_2v1112497 [Rhizophagus irregularis DAOM 181602=DAOM 197198]POG73444.1 hypothetical protein GLOIN_2v1112497 [Rhizophagus irregularis DAOM 181602=DAOM 197198]|eukprot:XP_025180310.1 hypothetical protein GLOIN_2v1112497 [Rhizophagus irregularis DAOM 181602=DAOM 197198]
MFFIFLFFVYLLHVISIPYKLYFSFSFMGFVITWSPCLSHFVPSPLLFSFYLFISFALLSLFILPFLHFFHCFLFPLCSFVFFAPLHYPLSFSFFFHSHFSLHYPLFLSFFYSLCSISSPSILFHSHLIFFIPPLFLSFPFTLLIFSFTLIFLINFLLIINFIIISYFILRQS